MSPVKSQPSFGAYVEDDVSRERISVILFSMKEEVGALTSALKIFADHGINLNHIESRSSRRFPNEYEFIVELDAGKAGDVHTALEDLRPITQYMTIISRDKETESEKGAVPWFPGKRSDLDQFANQILSYGADLDADHPGFTDPVYRARRKEFADIAFNYKHGQAIPRIEYTAAEIATWAEVYENLTKLYPTHACHEHNHIFQLMIDNCHYSKDSIPQLEDVSSFLRDATGFILRPVAGLLSSRDFLAGLAFRVFHATQYIRHPSRPLYTPEPDVCHELLGHAPLFANPAFARFSQEIGLASLGAPDEYIEQLATCYWFTVEYGLCKQDGQVKAFGAGLLSSFGELEYALTDKPTILAFDPVITGKTKYPITQYQPTYFLAESFEDAQHRLRQFALTIPRPFAIRYDPYTQAVEILDSGAQVEILARDIQENMQTLTDAITKIRRNTEQKQRPQTNGKSCRLDAF